MAVADVHYGGYDYDFTDNVHSRFVCTICTKVMRDPHLVVCCGQKFCESCLDRWLKKKSATCPLCREKFSGQFHHILEKGMKSEIESLSIHCLNISNGCVWTGELRELQKHLKMCEFSIKTCPHCNNTCILKDYLVHEGQCDFYPVDCPNNCGEQGVVRKSLSFHLLECKLTVVWCHNKWRGCNRRLVRIDMQDHINRHCKLRSKNCSHCGYETTVKGYLRHKEKCLNFPLDCPNHCGRKGIPRHALETHRNSCGQELVECRYVDVGCFEKIVRQDVPYHMIKYQQKHLEMVTDEYDQLYDDYDALSEELNGLRDELKNQRRFYRELLQPIEKPITILMLLFSIFLYLRYFTLALVSFICLLICIQMKDREKMKRMDQFHKNMKLDESDYEDDYVEPTLRDYAMFLVTFTGSFPLM